MQTATSTETQEPQVLMLKPDRLVFAPFTNIRTKRDPESYNNLKNSVARNGFTTAVTVRPAKEPGKYELIAGFGRKQVAIDLGIPLPCVVRDVDDKQAYEIHMTENLDREQLGFVDEIHAAKQFVSFYAGDKESAATRLGWSRKKLDERLELLACDDAVLKALSDGTIKAGHALLLAPFDQSVQQKTLQKILDEGLSVKDLRERARKVQIPLANAKFDTAGCQGCPFNSQQQSGLFDTADDGALCSKPQCFIEKNQAHLADVVEKQKESHGRVIFMTSSLQINRTTVSAANVGKAQFESGCSGCDSRAALVDDRPGHEGEVTPSQCLDRTCFDKCMAALDTAQVESETQNKASEKSASTRTGSKSGTAAPAKTAKPAVAQKTPERVNEKHKEEIRTFAGQHVVGVKEVRMAMMVLGLETLFGSNTHRAEDRIKTLMSLDEEELAKTITTTLDTGLKHASSIRGANSDFDFMATVLSSVEGGNDAAIESWVPTKDNLSAYYTQGLQGIAKSSGIEKTLPKGVTQGKKADLIKALTTTEHDWTDFAPAPFKKLLK